MAKGQRAAERARATFAIVSCRIHGGRNAEETRALQSHTFVGGKAQAIDHQGDFPNPAETTEA
jgi:hypothetical protein